MKPPGSPEVGSHSDFCQSFWSSDASVCPFSHVRSDESMCVSNYSVCKLLECVTKDKSTRHQFRPSQKSIRYAHTADAQIARGSGEVIHGVVLYEVWRLRGIQWIDQLTLLVLLTVEVRATGQDSSCTVNRLRTISRHTHPVSVFMSVPTIMFMSPFNRMSSILISILLA